MYKEGEISKIDDLNLQPWERGVRQGGKANKEIIKQNVLEFKDVLDHAQLKFCLIFGTLLGAIREQDIIAHDSDFDVFCFADDYLKWDGVKSQLEERNFIIPKNHPLHDDFVIRNGEKIDINWIFPFSKFYVYNNELYYPRSYFDNLINVSLFGVDFKAPCNPEQLLSDLYGSDWRIPKRSKGRINIYPK